jgi:hypothetical protein
LGPLGRLAVRATVTVLVIAGFLVGLAQFPTPATAPGLGVAFGLGSAICWGLTVAGGANEPFPWNGLFNAFAAICAAVAVGYLTPKEACSPPPSGIIPRFVCSVYPKPAPVAIPRSDPGR